jgi:type IV secretory pathway TraG/TraD family ATPase VirD4
LSTELNKKRWEAYRKFVNQSEDSKELQKSENPQNLNDAAAEPIGTKKEKTENFEKQKIVEKTEREDTSLSKNVEKWLKRRGNPFKKIKEMSREETGKGPLVTLIQKGFLLLLNNINFFGLWLWPLIYAVYRKTEIDILNKPITYIGVSCIICVGTLSLFLEGKRTFTPIDTICVCNLSEEIRRYRMKKAKNPPPTKELLLPKRKSGIYFGGVGNQDIGISDQTKDIYHMLVVGSSGCGKTSTFVIPTINRYSGSMLVVDIKDTGSGGGELARKTKNKGHRYILQPGEAMYGYDPFWPLKKGNASEGIRQIAHYMIPTDPTHPNDFWIQSSQRLLTALLYYFYDMDQSFCVACRSIYSMNIKAVFTKIQESTSRFAKEGISDFINMADETLGGIIGNIGSATEIFATDTAVMDFLNSKRIVTPDMLLEPNTQIFLCFPESKLEVYRPLMQIILSQFIEFFEDLQPEQLPKKNILFLIDEFPRIGVFPSLANALATIRSKGVRMCLVIQANSQLDHLYGKQADVILENVPIKLVLSTGDAKSSDYYSKLAGTYTAYDKSYSHSRSNSGRNVTPKDKPRIRPEELVTLPQKKKALLITPWGSFVIDKHPYYKK